MITLNTQGIVPREGKAWETWVSRLSSGSATFPPMIERFLADQGWGYEEFYQVYKQAAESSDKRDFAILKGRIVDFVEGLSRKRAPGKSTFYSRGTCKNHLIAIKSFIEANELPKLELTRSETKRLSAAGSAREKDSYSKDELRTLIGSTTSLRNKAIIYIGKDSGLRISDIASIRVGDVEPAIRQNEKVVQLDLIQEKTAKRVHPCLGYEALEAVGAWLRWRRDSGYDAPPESSLFIKVEGEGDGEPLSANNITSIFARMLRTAGLGDKVLSAHSLRVYNQSQLEANGVNKNLIYRLQGRQIPDSGRAYSRGDLLSIYAKNYEALAIGLKPQVIEVEKEDPRVSKMETEISELKAMLRAIYEKPEIAGRRKKEG